MQKCSSKAPFKAEKSKDLQKVPIHHTASVYVTRGHPVKVASKKEEKI